MGIVIGCIVAVLIAAGIALTLLVHPNDYKGRIQAAVERRDLSLGRSELLGRLALRRVRDPRV